MGYVLYEMPDGRKELINFDTDNDYVIDLVKRYCGDNFATMLSGYIKSLQDKADYETLKFNSDFEAYEAENEEFRDALNEIESLLQQYEYGLERGSEKFSRKRIESLFSDIHMTIEGVI